MHGTHIRTLVARFTVHVVSMSPSELRMSFLACWNVKPPSIRAPAEGKPLPSELRKEEAQLRHEIELEDDNTAVPRTHMDDEYAHAGERDPQAWRLCRPLGLCLVSHSVAVLHRYALSLGQLRCTHPSRVHVQSRGVSEDIMEVPRHPDDMVR